jgi:proteasome lid subunit RPN8/RPN11
MIRLEKGLFDRILTYLRSEYPNEGCGILAGSNGDAAEAYPVKNEEASPVSYFMHPGEQLRIFRKLEREGKKLVGIYHSHPSSEAYPSAKDAALAAYEDVFHLIVSFAGNETRARAFWIHEGKIEEDKIEWRG